MSRDPLLRGDDGKAYSFDRLTTLHYLQGRRPGLEAASAWLRERAGEAFLRGADERARDLRSLADEVLKDVGKRLDEAVTYQESTFPVVVEESDLAKKAKEAGAQTQWVTGDGYTQLPDVMLRDLGVPADGAHVWFLGSKPRRWEAWPEGELQEVFGPDATPGKAKELGSTRDARGSAHEPESKSTTKEESTPSRSTPRKKRGTSRP